MIIFNVLMLTSFALLMFVLVAIQAYILTCVIKELRRGIDFEYIICLIGIIGTSLATLGLVVGVTSMIFTGVV